MTAAFDVRNYVFIDEMGSNLSFTRLYGRAAAGSLEGPDSLILHLAASLGAECGCAACGQGDAHT